MNQKISSMVESIYGLTPLQLGMLYHHMLEPDSTSYVLQNVMRLNGKFNSSSMRLSLHFLSKKYEVLRTLMLYRLVEKPLQVVLKERKIEFTEEDYSNYNKDYVETLINNLIESDVKRGFDLEKDSLLRIKLIHINQNESCLIFTAHHIIIDGWCLSFLLHDILDFYKKVEKKTPIKTIEKEIQKERASAAPYRDFVKWIEDQDKEEGLLYWQKLLEEYDEVAVVEPLEIPEISHESVGTVSVEIDSLMSEQIRNFAIENQITISIIFEAAWAILLQKYNRKNDVVFGKVVSGRQKDLKGIEKAVGLFINTIPVRIRSDNETRVIDMLKALFNQEIKGFQHDYCSLVDIQQRNELKSNLFQSIFVFENYYKEHEFSDVISLDDVGLQIKIESSREQTNYPLSIGAYDTGRIMLFGIMYDKNLYTESNIQIICKQMEQMLRYIINDSNRNIKDIEVVTEQEKELILKAFNNTYTDFLRDKTVVDLFEKQVENTPNNIALQYRNQKLTYDELNKRANVIANMLRDSGVNTNDFVAILAKPSIEMIVGIMGIIKAGGCYVPLDANEPEERVIYKLEDCKPKSVLYYGVTVKTEIPTIDLNTVKFESTKFENPVHILTPNSLIYMIYTSGTTGRPKGVMIEHRSIVNFRESCIYDYGATDKDKVLLFASITFDASVGQIMLALLTGATLCIPDCKLSGDVNYINSYIRDEKISLLSFPPQFAAQIEPTECKLLLTAGSEANREVIKNIINYSDYINAYGPTEATICATYWKCDKGTKVPTKVSIGKPHKNYKIYILEGNNFCGIGVPGELCIGGEGLARGYFNRPELTGKVFINNPYGEGKIYRTGDLVRWLPDGNVEYLGRIDEQVKIRGYRIELNEVEGALRKISYVNDCTVVVVNNNYGEKCIAAYIVSDEKVSAVKIRDILKKHLPAYMVPEYVMQIDNIPVTVNGKVDKKRLSKIEIKSEREYVEPRNDIEAKVCHIFKIILGINEVGVNDSFLELGGNSISAIRLVSSLSKENINISLGDVVSKQTPESIAAYVKQDKTNDSREKEKSIDKILQLTPVQTYISKLEVPFQSVILKPSKLINVDAEKAAISKFINIHSIMGYQYDNDKKVLVKNDSHLEFVVENEVLEKDYSDEELLNFINEKLIFMKERSLFVINIKANDSEYIVISANLMFMDRWSWLIFIDHFIDDYNEYITYGRISEENIENHYILWQDRNNFADILNRNIVLKHIRNLELNMDISYQLNSQSGANTNDGLIDRITKIILTSFTEWGGNARGSLVYLEQDRLSVKEEVSYNAVGQYSQFRLIIDDSINEKESNKTNLMFTISFEDDLVYRAENSGFKIEEIYSKDMAGYSDLFVKVAIRNGEITFHVFARQDFDETNIDKFIEILKYQAEYYCNSKISPNKVAKCRLSITDYAIKRALKHSKEFDDFEVETEYSALARQKLFVNSSFTGVCIGKAMVVGDLSKDKLSAAINRVVNQQSALRSCYNGKTNRITEKRTEGKLTIPYFDLSAYSLTETYDFMARLEQYGSMVSRYKDDSLLAQHCIIRVSEFVSIVYLFAHHILCDMVSLHIWKQSLINSLYTKEWNYDNKTYRYSEFALFSNKNGEYVGKNALKFDRLHQDEKTFLNIFSSMNNSTEIIAISKNEINQKNIESAPALFVLDLLDSIIGIYEKKYTSDVPFLYIHHGRNQKNGMTIGLFIDLYKLYFRHKNKDSIKEVVHAMVDPNMLAGYPNLMDLSELDMEKIVDYPLININVANAEYNPEILGEILSDKTDHTRVIQFNGISIQLIFFTDALRLSIRCDKKYSNEIKELCIDKLGEYVVWE